MSVSHGRIEARIVDANFRPIVQPITFGERRDRNRNKLAGIRARLKQRLEVVGKRYGVTESQYSKGHDDILTLFERGSSAIEPNPDGIVIDVITFSGGKQAVIKVFPNG